MKHFRFLRNPLFSLNKFYRNFLKLMETLRTIQQYVYDRGL